MPSVNGRKCSKLARRREMMSESASEMPQKSKEKRMSSPRYARARATRSSAFGSARSTVFGMGAVDKRCDEANGEEAQQVIRCTSNRGCEPGDAHFSVHRPDHSRSGS